MYSIVICKTDANITVKKLTSKMEIKAGKLRKNG